MRNTAERIAGSIDRVIAAIGRAATWCCLYIVLAEFADPPLALARSRGANLLVRDARGYPGLSRCLRISIGTPEQNNRLLESFR